MKANTCNIVRCRRGENSFKNISRASSRYLLKMRGRSDGAEPAPLPPPRLSPRPLEKARLAWTRSLVTVAIFVQLLLYRTVSLTRPRRCLGGGTSGHPWVLCHILRDAPGSFVTYRATPLGPLSHTARPHGPSLGRPVTSGGRDGARWGGGTLARDADQRAPCVLHMCRPLSAVFYWRAWIPPVVLLGLRTDHTH